MKPCILRLFAVSDPGSPLFGTLVPGPGGWDLEELQHAPGAAQRHGPTLRVAEAAEAQQHLGGTRAQQLGRGARSRSRQGRDGGREVMEFGEWVGPGRREVGEVESFWGKACGGWCVLFFGGLRR